MPSPLFPLRPRALPRGLPRAASAALSALLTSLVLAACQPAPEAAAGGAASAAAGASAAPGAGAAASAPPVGVSTVRALRKDMPVLITATGTVTPLSSVDVRPQTTSLVTRVHVKEGGFVKAGQLLFTLDARAADADVAKARAQLQRSEAALADAQRQLRRSQELLAQNFISQGALDTTQTNVQSLSATLAADRAALDAVRLLQSYTRIMSPSAGRLGAINVFPGSAVQANQTPLVSITQLDPIAVAFSLPQRHLADALAALQDGGAMVSALPPEDTPAPASAAVPASAAPKTAAAPASAASRPAARSPAGPPPLVGRLSFVDNAVDAASGSIKVKARFDNRDGRLWPGAFVRVALTARVLRDAVVVPQAAIIHSARGALVYAVQDGKAVARPVQVLHAQGEDAAVSGLRPGERIVLDGRQNVRPGSPVVERGGEDGPARRERGGAAAPGSAPGAGRAAAGGPPAPATGSGAGAPP